MNPIFQNPFVDPFKKPLLEDGSLDSGVLFFSRPYLFSLSGNYSLTSLNTLVHTFDANIYPSSVSTATGFSVYATSSNSYSGYFYSSLMRLYNMRAIADYRGIFSVTSVTSSTTSALYNSGKFDPSKFQGVDVTLSSFSASITSLYYYHFGRSVVGDRILDGTLTLNNGLTLIAEESFVAKDAPVISLTSSQYQDSTTSATRFWVFPDTGELILWSSDKTTFNSLSAINNIQFSNSVAVSNVTLNAIIQPKEFNTSSNPSYYARTYSDGTTPDSGFSTIIFYNPWGHAIATAQIPRIIRKSTIPLNLKIILDLC